jgi:hypothetical protein
VFVIVSHTQPCLIFEVKAGSLHLEWSPIMGSTLVGSDLPSVYYTKVEVTHSDKHSSLLWYDIDYTSKNVYSTG